MLGAGLLHRNGSLPLSLIEVDAQGKDPAWGLKGGKYVC